MARRKNVKRIDPRYFLEETVLREGDEEALEELTSQDYYDREQGARRKKQRDKWAKQQPGWTPEEEPEEPKPEEYKPKSNLIKKGQLLVWAVDPATALADPRSNPEKLDLQSGQPPLGWGPKDKWGKHPGLIWMVKGERGGRHRPDQAPTAEIDQYRADEAIWNWAKKNDKLDDPALIGTRRHFLRKFGWRPIKLNTLEGFINRGWLVAADKNGIPIQGSLQEEQEGLDRRLKASTLEEVIDRVLATLKEERQLQETGADINKAFGGPINLRLPQTLIDRVKELMALPPGQPGSITPETGPTIVVQINNALQKADEAERAELHALKKELIDSGAVKQSRGQEDREAHRHRRAAELGGPLEEGDDDNWASKLGKDLDPQFLIDRVKEFLDSGTEINPERVEILMGQLYSSHSSGIPEEQRDQMSALLRALKNTQPPDIVPDDYAGDPYAAEHEERGRRAKANWDRKMHQRGGFKK